MVIHNTWVAARSGSNRPPHANCPADGDTTVVSPSRHTALPNCAHYTESYEIMLKLINKVSLHLTLL
jgi:hypothetical protein